MNDKKSFYLGHNDHIASNQDLSDKSKARLYHDKAENTIKAYNSDWRDFLDWCEAHNAQSLPATPEIIVNYINDLADNAKANTVARRVIAISENHIAAGYDLDNNPAKSNIVRAAVSAIKREKGTFQQGKMPILFETLHIIMDSMQGDSPTLIRDRALILLGFAGAFRRSELVAINVENLTFTLQGLIVFIPKAKSDQLGQGETVAIPFAPDRNICAVKAVKEWIDCMHLVSGPLFRPFKKNKQLRDMRLTGNAVAVIVKKYVKAAGFDHSQFAGHSLRRGFATSAAQHNVDVLGIMKQTRHKSEKMVHRYIEQGKLFTDNPLDKIYH